MYNIEKNIPLPGVGGNTKTSFLKGLELGDSFVVDSLFEKSQLWNIGRLIGIKLKSRAVGDGKYRIWHI